MTHVKKTEAFARLIGFCKGYGGIYNPGRPNLQIDALVNQLNETQSAIELVKVAKTNFDNQANQRRQKFDALPSLASSILRTLEASGAKPEKLKDARMFMHQLIGSSPQNRPPISSDKEAKPKVQRSQLQLAYVSKADTFSKLVKAVSSEPLYQPNEKNFGPIGLEEKIEELNQANREAADARALWSKAIIERNTVMYTKEVSLIKTAYAVKKYVRAIFGPNSEQYTLLKTLVFTIQ
ncbi:MAG: hypothetical protein ABI663_11520 [Chryseolinea sp.]